MQGLILLLELLGLLLPLDSSGCRLSEPCEVSVVLLVFSFPTISDSEIFSNSKGFWPCLPKPSSKQLKTGETKQKQCLQLQNKTQKEAAWGLGSSWAGVGYSCKPHCRDRMNLSPHGAGSVIGWKEVLLVNMVLVGHTLNSIGMEVLMTDLTHLTPRSLSPPCSQD